MPSLDLMERVHELVTERGSKWSQIALVLETEGYREGGQPLNSNTIRKRYTRWLKISAPQAQSAGASLKPAKKEPQSLSTEPPGPPRDSTISAGDVLELLKGSIERRDSILAAQLHKEHDKEYDTLREQRLETRLTARMEVRVSEVVGEELRAIQAEDSPFREILNVLMAEIVEARMSDHLASLLEGIEVKERSAGPGRGHKGSRVTKFSATVPSELYHEMKRIGGIFSSHLAAACELYLRARIKHPTDKE